MASKPAMPYNNLTKYTDIWRQLSMRMATDHCWPLEKAMSQSKFGSAHPTTKGCWNLTLPLPGQGNSQCDHGCKQLWSTDSECSGNLCLMKKLQSQYMLNLESIFNSKLLFITWFPLWAYLQEENMFSIEFHRILSLCISPWT